MKFKKREDVTERSKSGSYFALFLTFLKASTFTFAGGLAVVPAIERDAVQRYKLLSRDEFMEYATLSQTMPGVIALNCATLVGRRAAGLAGMLAAGFGAILPAFVLMVLATVLVNLIPQHGPLLGAMRGIRAASAALVLSAAFSLGRFNLKDAFAVILMIAAFLLVAVGTLSAPLVVVLAGVAGCLYQQIKRKYEGRKSDDH
ncbi:chromate transporter [Muricomes intestini]|uniref:chromate transporter n=1 Tax=Muricomes intestini TaxID=1796634 RepID=UPI002FE2911C